MNTEKKQTTIQRRFIFVTPVVDKYGASRTLYSILKKIENEGYNCEVWYPKDEELMPDFYQEFSELIIFRQMNLPVLRRKKVYNFRFFFTLADYFRSGFRIRKIAYSKKNTNAIFHIFTSASVLAIFLVPKKRRIISVHEFSKNKFERLLLKWLFMISRSNLIFASEAVMSHYKLKGKVIYSGANINIQNIHKKKIYKPGRTLNILCVGRITFTKGQLILLNALPELVKNKVKFKVKFVGSPFGDVKDYMESCEKFVRLNKLDNYVDFEGEKKSVERYYLWSHLVIVPSIHPEAFGKVIIEGMASSNVILASNIGGPLEIIKNGFNGLLFSPNSPQEISTIILKIVHENYDLQNILINSLKTAELFDEKLTSLKYLEALLSVN